MSIRQKRFDTTRYGFQEGDRVKTKEEYEGNPFSGEVLFFGAGFVYIRKDDGWISAIHPYWLEIEK